MIAATCTLPVCEHRTTRVTARDAHLDQIVTGCRLIRDGKRGMELRNQEWVAMHQEGLNARQISEATVARLLAEKDDKGRPLFTDDDLKDLGVSAWNVRRALKGD